MPALALVTYALLVMLAARDPIFAHRVLRGREAGPATQVTGSADVSPERRARWLPRGETREKVEAALVVYRKVVVAIEEADDVTRAVLDDAIPKLHAAAGRLVDVAERREQAAEVLRDLDRHDTGSSPAGPGAREGDARALQEKVHAADAEISKTFDGFLALRSRVVRVSIDSGDPERAADLNTSLDELNARLEALSETMTPPEARTQGTPKPP